MPEVVQYMMLGAPTTHFVMLAQAIQRAGIIGAILFGLVLGWFRKAFSETG